MENEAFEKCISRLVTEIQIRSKSGTMDYTKELMDQFLPEAKKMNEKQSDKFMFVFTSLTAYPELLDFKDNESSWRTLTCMRTAWRSCGIGAELKYSEFLKNHIVFSYEEENLPQKLKAMSNIMVNVEDLMKNLHKTGMSQEEKISTMIEYINSLRSKYGETLV